MATYRVQLCRRVWETASIEIEDAESAEDAAARAEAELASFDEDSLDWSTSDADSEAEVSGVTELAGSPRRR